MFRKSRQHPLKPGRPTPILDADLSAVVGGLYRQPTTINFPPLPSIPQRSLTVPLTTPSPLSVSTLSSGGTGQSPIHVISGSYNGPNVFASATLITPSVPSIPPMPSVNGTFTAPLQTLQVNAGFRFRLPR